MKTVKEIMVAAPKYCGKQESLQSVVSQMSKSNIGSLPVVDENKKVIGIVTNHDVCIALGKTNKAPHEIKVQDVMTAGVHTCQQEDDPSTVLKIMRTKRVSRLPVVDKEQRLKGILSLNGIVRSIYDGSSNNEVAFAEKENILSTIHSIAERNAEHAGEYYGE
ncbi:MAG TPA: CBS domain-containing protein [Bacteroidia bacterium]|nr:CBS domain-containing protein [Bacteroidia bacterium]